METSKLQEILLSKLSSDISADQLIKIYELFTSAQGPVIYRGLHISNMTQAEFDRLSDSEKDIQYNAVKSLLFPDPESDDDEELPDPASSPTPSPKSVKGTQVLQARIRKTYKPQETQ